jgi:hypothetical protein
MYERREIFHRQWAVIQPIGYDNLGTYKLTQKMYSPKNVQARQLNFH